MTRLGYWLLISIATTLVLAGMSLAASSTLKPSPRHREITNAEGVGLYNGRIRHKVSNNMNGQAVFNVEGILPGWAGRRRMVLSNVGPQPFGRVTLTQDLVDTGGFSSALQLQVYDVTTQRCLYPRPPVEKRVPRVRTELHRCARWMPWDGRQEMRFMPVPGKDRSLEWKRREQHLIFVRWRLAPSSPNSDQRRRASFRLRWNTSS